MHVCASPAPPQLDLHDREAAAAEARTPQVERRPSRKQSQEQAKAKAAEEEAGKTDNAEPPSSAGSKGEGSGEEKDEVRQGHPPETFLGPCRLPPVL